tara:strand:- start:1517 stop:1729 length:213 start_codon:yes stop_codon:yes gene_type:complete
MINLEEQNQVDWVEEICPFADKETWPKDASANLNEFLGNKDSCEGARNPSTFNSLCSKYYPNCELYKELI